MAAGGSCSGCEAGKYQGYSNYLGELCTDCELGKFADHENATACEDCYKPICAEAITWCDAQTGASAYTPLDPIQAPYVVCRWPDRFDACDLPEHCRADGAVCDEIDRRAELTLESPCPSLLSTTKPSVLTTPIACWDQATHGGTQEQPHYSSNDASLTAVVPLETMRPTCDGQPVAPRYSYYFVACQPNSAECTEEKLDCPVDEPDFYPALLSARWWESMGAETLYETNVTTATKVTAPLPQGNVHGRTVHVIVHLHEPSGSVRLLPPRTELGTESALCHSRRQSPVP